ncbi:MULTISPECIES: hypothetical protein [Flammeovirga]|uniref:Uncharacterized protein n=1 Tax=Flammeovirga agarivorans TaxID=2726742 RepID=A0A7X8SQZ2_9BACT|nr:MULTISPECIES: hypothetical protein [Flammeovirga]NLR94799.1 hypothetical protein [Flammeovirga agarivorans]
MKRSPFFKLLQHRTFDFTTRYYDAEKEERDARIKALHEKYSQSDEEKEKNIENIEDRIDFTRSRQRKTEHKPMIIRAFIVAAMFGLMYYLFK